MKKSKVIIIDPRSSYSYGSFYLYGLRELFGRSNVFFSIKPFRELPDLGWNMRFISVCDNSITKYFLHTNDTWRIQEEDYIWCDYYGSVNANFSKTPIEKYPKLISLVPSFAVCALPDKSATSMAFKNVLSVIPTLLERSEWNKNKNKEDVNFFNNLKHYFGRIYKTQKQRVSYSLYDNRIDSRDDFVFFCSTLWYDNFYNKNDNGVNLRRALFMRACKEIPWLCFEGGFVGDMSTSQVKYADLMTQRVTLMEWIEKTKQSAFVFNTPAFWDCHGWKLGEYLALGKCIISTPLSNDLPAPLKHGIHIHYVEPTKESIHEAISFILSHKDYRLSLERNALAYWKQYGTPVQSLHLLNL